MIRGFLERGLLSVVCREKVQSKGKPQYSTEKGWVDLFVYLTFVVSWFYQMANNDPEWPHVISAEKEPFGNQGIIGNQRLSLIRKLSFLLKIPLLTNEMAY